MNASLPTYRGKGICQTCGANFEKRAQNQVYCPECSFWKQRGGGSLSQKLSHARARLKKLADESGNPVIWRRGDPIEGLPEGMRRRVEKALNSRQ
jgi:predicted amidophosphoribosyltransferase